MLDHARRRLPAHVTHLSRLGAPVVPDRLGRVVVVPRVGLHGQTALASKVQYGMYRPCTRSTSARLLNAFGASHLLAYQRANLLADLACVTLNGSRLCGLIGALISV